MMTPALIYKGYVFSGSISLKMSDGTSPENIFPYPIQVGAEVRVVLPPADTLVPVVLSTLTPLPSPFVGNEVTITDMTEGQITFTCPASKSLLMALGNNLSLDVIVINDPTTVPAPVEVYAFQKQKVLNIVELDNL